ncbi:MAG: non-canonical purine NTP diphosphatase [Saprospiraceae bacterium]|nr:non-canonical purine NTP diphosphatase [Saprospiraceae bacterium]
MPQILVFATNNAHKALEVEQILGPDFQIKTLRDIGCTEDIEETEDTLEGNAILKARYVKHNYGYDCFSEDTGLEVTALGGAPGVHTARYAGESRDPQANIHKLLENLKDKADRSAQFRTVIAMVRGEETVLFEGICKGHIAEAPSGTEGFGYDPVFVPEGYDVTFAQLGVEVKNVISHRARAMGKLVGKMGEIHDFGRNI